MLRLVLALIALTLGAFAQAKPEATMVGYFRCRDRANGWFASPEENKQLSLEQLQARIEELDTCYQTYYGHQELTIVPDPAVVIPLEARLNFYAKPADLTTMLFLEATYEQYELTKVEKQLLQCFEFIKKHHLMKEFAQYQVAPESSAKR